MSRAAPDSAAPTWLGPVVVALVLAALAAAWLHTRPPRARPATAPAAEFSAARARRHLAEISRAPHPVGSEEHARVRRFLVEALRELEIEPEIHQTTAMLQRGPYVRAATVRSILGRLPGSGSTGAVALAAHYDSRELAPGAGDDGAAVAALIEAVRALRAGPPLRNDLVILITDAEELGLLGARAFVDEHPWAGDISVVLNFEGRGGRGPSVMFETSPENGWVVRELARADPHPIGSSFFYEVYQRLPNDTDFSVFKAAGWAGLNFALAEGADRYHRPTDTAADMPGASIQHHGEHMLSLSRHFGGLDLSEPRAPNVVFFDLPILGLVTYSTTRVTLLTIVVVAAAVFVSVLGFRRRQMGIGSIVVGLLLVVAAAALCAGAGWLMWRGAAELHPENGAIVGRRLYNESRYMLAIVSLSLCCTAALLGLARRRLPAPGLAFGAILVPLALTLVTAWSMPGANMLFLWPCAATLAAIAWLLWRDSTPGSRTRGARDGLALADAVVLGLVALPVFALQLPLFWALFVGLSIAAAPILAVSAVIVVALLLPQLEVAGRSNRWWIPATAGLLAVAFFIAGRSTASTSAERPAPTSLLYLYDHDAGTPRWATADPGVNGWSERFVPLGAGEPAPLDGFLSGSPVLYRTAPAPLMPAERPAVELVEDSVDDNGTRSLRVAIRSPIGAEMVRMMAPSPNVVPIAINGHPIDRVAEGSAPSQPWIVEHWGVPSAAIVLDLEATVGTLGDTAPTVPAAPAAVELVVVETVFWLGDSAGRPEEARPPSLTPNAGIVTDRSLFRTEFSF